jgi:hypothetical protein
MSAMLRTGSSGLLTLQIERNSHYRRQSALVSEIPSVRDVIGDLTPNNRDRPYGTTGRLIKLAVPGVRQMRCVAFW